jgi:anti-repressor protein
MNEPREFNFKGWPVRTVLVGDEPMFVGKDVAEILGYENPSKAVRGHVDAEDKIMGVQNGTPSITDSMGRVQYPTFINESGLYSLIMSSKMPNAKEFKHWVTSEVLPSIRKHGAYMTPATIERALLDPDTIIGLATELKQERAARMNLEGENNRLRPKALFADAVSASDTTILVGDLAKLLRQNGVEIGANRLFKWLRRNGYLIRREGADYNSPTQKAVDQGLFKIKESTHINGDGNPIVTKTPRVTGKGQRYFLDKFLAPEVLA